jgi:hypothetical protein
MPQFSLRKEPYHVHKSDTTDFTVKQEVSVWPTQGSTLGSVQT